MNKYKAAIKVIQRETKQGGQWDNYDLNKFCGNILNGNIKAAFKQMYIEPKELEY